MTRTLALGASSLAALSLAAPASAQDRDVDEIVVTATKREQQLSDVPFSVNAQTENDIRRSGSQNLEDVARNVAGLAIQNLGPGQSQVAIRGVSAGQIVRDQPGVKEQVGIYLDDSVISLSLFTPDLDLFDLARLETLRGPQGTLFGSGSIGGTLRYITNQAEIGERSGLIEADLNQIEEGGLGGHLKGVVNVPVGDTLAIRAVAYHTEYGGYVDAFRSADLTGELDIDDDVNSGHRTGGRLMATFEPNDRVSIRPRIVYQEIETDGFNRQEAFNLFANPNTTERRPIQLGEREQFLLLDEAFEDETLIADLAMDFRLGRGVTLTSVTSYTERDVLVSRDASALTGSVSVDLGFPDEAVLLPSNLRDTTDVEQWTQELRIASDTSEPFTYVVGLFWADTDRFYRQRLPTSGYDAFTDDAFGEGTSEAVANGFPLNSPYNADLPYSLKQFAAFAEGNLELTERLRVTAGARYYDYDEERRFTTGGLFSNADDQVDDTASDGINPRFILSYDATDAITVNAQAAKGFRLGGVNDPLNETLCQGSDLDTFGGFQAFDDETLWNYEAGVKVNTENLRVGAAAFYADITDLQVTLDAGSCSSRVVFNVPEAHTKGIEFEVEATPGANLELSVAGSLLEAEFDSTVLDDGGNVLGGIEDGNRLASTPEFQIAAAATWFYEPGFADAEDGYVSITAQHVGSRFTQPGDQVPGAGTFVSGLPFAGATGNEVSELDLELEGYEIVNLVTGLEVGGVELAAYVTNLLDENANLSFDRERGGRARLGFRTNQPRTFGVTVRKGF